MNELIEKIKKARFVWVCGNGGSASTAEHFVTDLVKKGYPAICLNSNTSVITMIANDYGYDEIFSKQLEAYATEDDLLITISCSGTSANIVKAKDWMKNLVHDPVCLEEVYSFEVFGKETDYGLLEDKHLKFAHKVAKKL